jgi:hypothetical protein
MAYNLKYFSRFRDIDGVIKEIRFLKKDYEGEVTEWFNANGAVDIAQGASDSLIPDRLIVTSQARISLVLTEIYDLTEFAYDRKTFFCQKVALLSGKVEWSGWVEPWDAARPYNKPPHPASLTASCGLAHLSKKRYINPSGSFKKTGLQIIQDCLSIIGSELPLRVSTHMYENSFLGDPVYGLESFEINTARYYNTSGEPMYCDQIINDILNKYTAELTQFDNKWVVRSIVDHATGTERGFADIDTPGAPLPWPDTYVINDLEAFTKEGGQIRLTAPINKYRTEVDLGGQKPYFENGNMVLWTENGLVGWDFSHMAKGNPGWEKFVINSETGQSILRINGQSPGPYEKRKKVKLFKKLLNLAIKVNLAATGAVGALLNPDLFKGDKYHLEPDEWIESPRGAISKGDKTVKISFDYFTAPNSSNVMFSIRFILTDPVVPGQGTDRWVAPGTKSNGGTEGVGTDNEFTFILAAPTHPEGIVYKGQLNAASSPNYPPGTAANWGYIIVGIPEGESRRIGGVNGATVQNGDTLISKVPNPGGTHEAVGGYWIVIQARNNKQKGTFSVEIPVDAINIVSKQYANNPVPYGAVVVRFYKITNDAGKTGDWYNISNLQGELSGFVASNESSQYATTLERGSVTDEEAATIPLITGDYTPWYTGTLTKPGSNEPTNSWRRRPALNESLSVYRAMMLDRLCMTSLPLTVMEGSIKVMPNEPDLSYFHTLILKDLGNMRMRIVRYLYNDYTRTAKVTAIEIKYEEIPASELKQDSYIPGSKQLNSVPGQGDGVYPTKEDSTNGRIFSEDIPLAEDDLVEVIQSSARMAAPFDGIPPLTFIVAVESTDSVNLKDYISEAFKEINEYEGQDPEDVFDLETLILSVEEKPLWVSEVEFDKLDVSATAIAPITGSFYLILNATDEESGLLFDFRVQILVEPSEDFAETWPPIFTDFPDMYFTIGKESTAEIMLSDYMDEEHALAKGYSYRILDKPAWVSLHTVIFQNLAVTGKPTTLETRRLLVEIKDSIGRKDLITINLVVLPAPKHTYTIMDTDLVSIVGEVPGSYELPVKWDFRSKVEGKHNRIVRTLKGGGPLNDEIDVAKDEEVTETDLATYRMFQDTDGVTTEAGQFAYTEDVYLGARLLSSNTITFVLYDEEYLSKMKAFLTVNEATIGEINADGSTVFDHHESWNGLVEITDIEHDEVILNMGEHTRTYLLEEPTLNGSYALFEEDVELPHGVYTIPVLAKLAGVEVEKRTYSFKMSAAAPKPEAGFKLVSYKPGTGSYSVVGDIPEIGFIFDLPEAYGVLYVPDVEINSFEWKYYKLDGGNFTEINLETLTGYPQNLTYPEPTANQKILLFGNKKSTQITGIHEVGRFRADGTARDVDGKILQLVKADWTFRAKLAPGDYSGLEFWKETDVTFISTQIDSNVPKLGASYALPFPDFWTLSFTGFKDGTLYDRGVVKLWKNGVQLELEDGYVKDSSFPPTDNTESGHLCVMGLPDALNDRKRYLFTVAGRVKTFIDEPGEYRAVVEVYSEGILLASPEATITLTEPLPEPEIKDCCCEGGDSIWFANEW